MTAITLYQFELCPYCHKVKAGLELKGINFTKVEVNPMSKKEIKHLPPASEGRRKVPIVEFEGGYQRESGDILRRLDEFEPTGLKMVPTEGAERERADEINKWVDEHFTQILPTVLYGTWGEAVKAARLTAETSNFSRFDNLKVSLFGSVVMKMIAKRILKRRGEGKTPDQLFQEQLDILESHLGNSPFLGGSEPNMADAAAHGPLVCVQSFPAFEKVAARPVLKAWFDRVAQYRQDRAAA